MSLLKMSQPMQVLVSRNTEEWYTPKEIVERVRSVLGSITLDPASDPLPQSWICAERYFSQADDGLSKTWSGRVFLNPPYNGSSGRWAAKLIDEYRAGRVEQAIMLINSAHGYKWYEDLWTSFPVCCLRDRLRFIKPTGETGGQAKKAQTLVYLGRKVARFARGFEDLGRILFPEGVDQRSPASGVAQRAWRR
jgi:phage N-6-adenine-methyltransferase